MSQVKEKVLDEGVLCAPRSRLLVPAMSGSHLGSLLALARLQAPHFPVSILRHQESFSARDKQNFLPDGIYVQKSLTLVLGEHLLLLSGLGDFRLERAAHIRTLARLFLLRAQEARRHEINPPSLSSQFATGLAPGMVSPFFPPESIGRLPLSAVVIFPFPQDLPRSAQVAISLSLSTSLLYPVASLSALIAAYGLRYYPHIPLLSFPGDGQGRTKEGAPLVEPQLALQSL